MSSYKLHYFDSKGVAEPARTMLYMADQKYEDIRYTWDEWMELKPKTPYGTLPILEVDGVKIPQSQSITRFIAQKFGFAGKNPIETALIDSVNEEIRDFFNLVAPYLYAQAGHRPGDLEKMKNEELIPARDKHFPMIARVLNENKTGFLFGDSVTYPDIFLAHFYALINVKIPGVFNTSPEIDAHQKKIHAIPKIAEWIEKRPNTYH